MLLWPEAAPSNLLGDILTEERLTVSSTDCYKFKGDPLSYQSPHHLDTSHFGLLRNP